MQPQFITTSNNKAHALGRTFSFTISPLTQTNKRKDLSTYDKAEIYSLVDGLWGYSYKAPQFSESEVDSLGVKSGYAFPRWRVKNYYKWYINQEEIITDDGCCQKKGTVSGNSYTQAATSYLHEAYELLEKSKNISNNAKSGLTNAEKETCSVQYLKDASGKLYAAKISYQNASSSFYTFDARVRDHYNDEQKEKAEEIRNFLKKMITDIESVHNQLYNKLKDQGLLN